MLMMNAQAPGARPGAPGAAPPGPSPQPGGMPGAPLPQMPPGQPGAPAGGAPAAARQHLKGTMLGVAPPSLGAQVAAARGSSGADGGTAARSAWFRSTPAGGRSPSSAGRLSGRRREPARRHDGRRSGRAASIHTDRAAARTALRPVARRQLMANPPGFGAPPPGNFGGPPPGGGFGAPPQGGFGPRLRRRAGGRLSASRRWLRRTSSSRLRWATAWRRATGVRPSSAGRLRARSRVSAPGRRLCGRRRDGTRGRAGRTRSDRQDAETP